MRAAHICRFAVRIKSRPHPSIEKDALDLMVAQNPPHGSAYWFVAFESKGSLLVPEWTLQERCTGTRYRGDEFVVRTAFTVWELLARSRMSITRYERLSLRAALRLQTKHPSLFLVAQYSSF